MHIDISEPSPLATLIKLDGRLDTLGVDRVEARFNAAAISTGKNTLVDLSGVSFMSSMGVRMLISAARAMRQRQAMLVLFAPQPLVRETLQTMAVDTLIALVQSELEARALVKA